MKRRPRGSGQATSAPGTRRELAGRTSQVVPRRRSKTLTAPSAAQVIEKLAEFPPELSLVAHEEEILYLGIRVVRTLFPSRLFAVRLLGGPGTEPACVYATGKLTDDAKGPVEIPRALVAEHGIDTDRLKSLPVRIVDGYRPVFSDSSSGFAMPLLDPQRLYGLVNVEYPSWANAVDADRALIAPFVAALTSALSNARLLRESVQLREQLDRILADVSAPIAVVGPDGRVRLVNDAMEVLTGLPRASLLGRNLLTLIPDAPDAGRASLGQALNAGRATNIEVRLPRKGSSVGRAIFSTSPLVDADGEVDGIVVIGRDLTELHSLQEQVIQSEKLATLGQLAAGVVHELNNPLTSIRAYSEYLVAKLERAGADAGDCEKLRRILEAAERILRFTSDLTSYAHPSSGERRELDVREVLEQAIVFCDHIIRDARVRVERGWTEVPAIIGIKSQLHQVFINLITNACHACEGSEGLLTVSTHSMPDGSVRVDLTDNGSGIRDEKLETIFEPFYSTKKDGKGTGLGLSIVRRILDFHGALIRVRSQVGAGSTFEVWFPAAGSEAPKIARS